MRKTNRVKAHTRGTHSNCKTVKIKSYLRGSRVRHCRVKCR